MRLQTLSRTFKPFFCLLPHQYLTSFTILRDFSTNPSPTPYATVSTTVADPLHKTVISPSKWLSHSRSRIGKCLMLGLSKDQVADASFLLNTIGREWREMIVGREGFLLGPRSQGIVREPVRWGEMDMMGHVNNVTYIRYAETGRINWIHNFAVFHDPEHKKEWSNLWKPDREGMILRSIKTEYKFPMTYPDHVSVFHKLAKLPSTDFHSDTFTLDALILSERHQRVAARCVEDIVLYDYKASRKMPMRPWMQMAFQRLWEYQEQEKFRAQQKIQKVERLIEALERSTWNKEGAMKGSESCNELTST